MEYSWLNPSSMHYDNWKPNRCNVNKNIPKSLCVIYAFICFLCAFISAARNTKGPECLKGISIMPLHIRLSLKVQHTERITKAIIIEFTSFFTEKEILHLLWFPMVGIVRDTTVRISFSLLFVSSNNTFSALYWKQENHTVFQI